jgi:hypothetical protein
VTADQYKTLGGRLRWAIDRMPAEGRKRGLRLFQRRLGARAEELSDGIDGTALSTIQGYCNDEQEPSLGFLREASAILRVRIEWLAFGSGMPTEVDTGLHEVSQRLQSIGDAFRGLGGRLSRGWREAVWGALEEAVPDWWSLPDGARGAAVGGFRTYLFHLWADTELTADEAVQKLAPQYAAYLAAPFEILGLDAGSLGPVERALIIDALVRPIEVARWATQEEDSDG